MAQCQVSLPKNKNQADVVKKYPNADIKVF